MTTQYMMQTTPDMAQVGVDGWIKDITYGIMALRNIKSSTNADYFSQAQRESIKLSVQELNATLQELRGGSFGI